LIHLINKIDNVAYDLENLNFPLNLRKKNNLIVKKNYKKKKIQTCLKFILETLFVFGKDEN
jgi:hypothetical protein